MHNDTDAQGAAAVTKRARQAKRRGKREKRPGKNAPTSGAADGAEAKPKAGTSKHGHQAGGQSGKRPTDTDGPATSETRNMSCGVLMRRIFYTAPVAGSVQSA
eukprot:15130564-Alexandrium_andersonii.AAC.1